MELVTLVKVIRETRNDPAFLDDLLGNVRGALNRKGWRLSVKNMTQLKQSLAERKSLAKATNKMFHHIVRDENPWLPPPWQPLWSKFRGKHD